MEQTKYYKREGRRFVKVELPQIPTITTNNAGKYYQSDGTFVNERTKDSIGLCIISLNTGHVVMALKDCDGYYTHDEAIEEVKNHFNGKGEIPNVNEMLEAFINYNEELKLKYHINYRIIPASGSNDGLFFFGVDATSSSVIASIDGLRWVNSRIKLRPIVRIK